MKLYIPMLFISLLIVSCGGGYHDGIIQKSEKSYLKFTGEVRTATISIDEGEEFYADPMVELIEINPGKHTIKAFRNNKLILNRIIILDNKTTMEIQVP